MTSKSTFKRITIQRGAKVFTVIFRSGGTDNFTWNRTLLEGTREEMRIEADKIERGGRKALVLSANDLAIGGLPESFE